MTAPVVNAYTAFVRDPRTREWAVSDADLEAIRDDPVMRPRTE